MHLPDTILLDNPAGVGCAVVGAAVTAAGLGWSGRRLDPAAAGRAGMVAAFVCAASAVDVTLPLVGLPVHLGLYGLAGLVLGRRVFLVAPVVFGLQAVLLGEGGLAAVGLNAANMCGGALGARWAFRAVAPRVGDTAAGFVAGFLGLAGAALLTLAELLLIGYPLAVGAFLPVGLGTSLVEGAVTAVAVRALRRLRPDLLPTAAPRPRSAVRRARNAAEAREGAA